MLNKTKYWKSLLGTFADVLITKQVDYAGTGTSTSGTDFKTFVANAVEGEFGFFDFDTLLVVSGVSVPPIAAAPLTQKIFGAVKRNGYIEKTRPFKVGELVSKRRTPFAAATAQQSTTTFVGTPVVGKRYGVKIIETTPGNQPFPTWEYAVIAVTGDTSTTIANKIAALIVDQTNLINKNTDPVVTSASNAAAVLTITAALAGSTFKIAWSKDTLTDLAPVAAYTGGGTALGYFGSGTYDQIAELEQESDVYKAVGTQYPATPSANSSDFGAPTPFATVGVQYNLYILEGYQLEPSPTPFEQHRQHFRIILAVTNNGAAKSEEEVKAILGL